jgi:hypothetical protein
MATVWLISMIEPQRMFEDGQLVGIDNHGIAPIAAGPAYAAQKQAQQRQMVGVPADSGTPANADSRSPRCGSLPGEIAIASTSLCAPQRSADGPPVVIMAASPILG